MSEPHIVKQFDMVSMCPSVWIGYNWHAHKSNVFLCLVLNSIVFVVHGPLELHNMDRQQARQRRA